ncbi:von Willebrand factor A domain-containing protein 5A-like [Lepidochelys kempii]|uniref:von Willebrand factor A domain-containing protein 5A-like n=1 Tax=Lepidochelys kempii TaxID=8472 RepID=UPI003C6FB7F0
MSRLPQPLPGRAPMPAVRVYGRGGREHPGHHRRGAASLGNPQLPDIPMGGITLQYRIQDQTYKETLQFSLQPQDGDRLPVHRLAAKSLLLELEGAVGAGSEGDGRRALEASLSSGVVCSLTTYVGVDMERGQLVRWDVPLAGNPQRGWGSWHQGGPSMWGELR